MTSGEIADSLHKQIEEWAKDPQNKTLFERWYGKARRKSENLYHKWRSAHLEKGAEQADATDDFNPVIWRENQGIHMDIRTAFMAASLAPGQQYERSREDYGIWNPDDIQNIGARNGPDAMGIHISPFLVSRNKFISKFGRS